MTKGISQESKELRHHLLSHNGPDAGDTQCEKPKNNYLKNRSNRTLLPFYVPVERWKSVRIFRWGRSQGFAKETKSSLWMADI